MSELSTIAPASDAPADTGSSAPTPRHGALAAWWRAAWRSAVGLRPGEPLSQPGPVAIALLMATRLLLSLATQRLMIDGPATFNAPALQSGWLSSLVSVWLCWLLTRRASRPRPDAAIDRGATLFGLLLAQSVVILVVGGLGLAVLFRSGLLGHLPAGVLAVLWWAPWGWSWLVTLRLMQRQVPARSAMAALAAAVVTAAYVLDLQLPHDPFWYPAREGASERYLRLTPQAIEAQSGLLARATAVLAPQRPGIVDLYAITFAPYADEEVFRRESALVDAVMQQRFDARGRSLQLVNHAQTAEALPWATAQNLRRAIEGVAAVMDRDEDVLFIHLTSHGARGGELAASLWPLEVPAVTPVELRAWLDAAGVRYRVLSISACYAGSWIAPLAGDTSLVMTAADAEHTSYGCGRKSALTFFGRAMYDEALRETHSFERAHARARGVIERREREAGKDDGYSNPQISVGAAIRAPLAALERRLQVAPTPTGSLQSPTTDPDSQNATAPR
ncbi:C13 family peptidase [Methylibium sp.]|uniref:C13 family peptidase n=1 Tax=Methylibium sp. TaxID=2067992 RepID=UPI00286B6422|nr:C13 family peptidase [Methylibium sp.]